jgi:hypothetical protein
MCPTDAFGAGQTQPSFGFSAASQRVRIIPCTVGVIGTTGPFADRDGLRDLTAPVFKDTRVLRPAYAALGSQVVQQLLLQRTTGLNEQASVNGFLGHTHALFFSTSISTGESAPAGIGARAHVGSAQSQSFLTVLWCGSPRSAPARTVDNWDFSTRRFHSNVGHLS